MSNETVVLITGTNRGLGLGLAKLYLQQPNTRVILTARSNTTAVVDALPKSNAGVLHGIYKLDSASNVDAVALRESLTSSETGVSKIDIIIANAGIGEPFDSVLDAPIDALENFYRANTLGPVRLYQQLWKDLLEKSTNPKFILISSALGSVTYVDKSPCGGYGASKAAANYFVRKMHMENEKLTAVVLHPGWVKTDNGQAYADAVNVSEPPLTVEKSVDKIFEIVSAATKEGMSGNFIDIMTGSDILW
ncbi:toxin biosynthesis ketoreductase, putative [Talaromyces stipitatus ATCC 10500]|uniref:Toxin biosynthesis ketoreductase, putative n=1 Tax=Talaromyces stipitatus (strain ATCC 10500 / CBS 375.48 / QM 6759 / NRRL 1006) TaxID=441959 RepID=B8MAJ2_TALSN|nr:toxin biosynthesis ketoreductase, putative [Talaromyces stipitatus ATCC 10500]EED17416.1 toxin biosynthesis ketoreductase, putative [Talaromyces stipitatus ATCC 10500]